MSEDPRVRAFSEWLARMDDLEQASELTGRYDAYGERLAELVELMIAVGADQLITYRAAAEALDAAGNPDAVDNPGTPDEQRRTISPVRGDGQAGRDRFLVSASRMLMDLRGLIRIPPP